LWGGGGRRGGERVAKVKHILPKAKFEIGT